MEAKCYRAMQRAQIKMLREYFSGVPFENLTRRYGYSEKKIKELDKVCQVQPRRRAERRTYPSGRKH